MNGRKCWPRCLPSLGRNSCDGCSFKHIVARCDQYLFVSSFILPHHSLVLFVHCLIHRALNTLHGDVHSNNLHVCHDNGQHPGITSSLVKNLMKIFFITIVPTTISIKTRTVRGHSDRRRRRGRGGDQVCVSYLAHILCSLSF